MHFACQRVALSCCVHLWGWPVQLQSMNDDLAISSSSTRLQVFWGKHKQQLMPQLISCPNGFFAALVNWVAVADPLSLSRVSFCCSFFVPNPNPKAQQRTDRDRPGPTGGHVAWVITYASENTRVPPILMFTRGFPGFRPPQPCRWVVGWCA